MRKKTKKNLYVWGGIILAIAVLIGIILMASGNFPGLSTSGFSTMSLTQANLESNAPSGSPFTGKAWLLTVRLGGLGQTAFGSFSPSDVQDETSGDVTTTKDFTISVNQQDQECIYPIQNTNQFVPVKKWAYQRWVYFFNCDLSDATSRGISSSSLRYTIKPSGSLYCYAVYSTEQAPVGIYGKTDIRIQANVDIEAGSRSGSYKIDSTGSSQGPVSDFAYVTWDGNLNTGKSCPYTTDIPYRPVYRNGQWINGDKQAYDLYVSKFNEGAQSTFLGGGDEIIDYISALNSRADNAMVSRSFGSFENRGSQSNARLVSALSSPIQNPVLTFYIKADVLGIHQPLPEIKLSSASSDCFKTGEDGFVSLKAKNIGDETGTWNFYGTCDQSFSVREAREYSISAGSEKTITLPLSASASSKTTGSCTIFAESPAGTEQITTSVCVDPQITCEANQLFCGVSGGNSVVKQCSADGATSSIKEICPTGQVCVASGSSASCKAEGTGGGSGFFSAIGEFFKNLFSGTFGLLKTIKIGLIVLGSIITLFISAGQLRRIKELDKIVWLRWIFAVAIAGFMAYVLYLFIGSFIFWVILAGVLVYNIVFSQLGVFINLRKVAKRR